MTDFIDRFAQYLQAKEASPKTVINYLADLRHFARWFALSNGQELALKEITPTDVRDYRGYLLAVERRQPATVNRRLTTLRRLCAWAKREGLLGEDPTADIKGVEMVRMAPRSLEKKEVDRLIRYAERQGNKRNLAILQVLKNTGLRVGELCNLRLGGIATAFTLVARRWGRIAWASVSRRVERLASSASSNWRKVRRLRGSICSWSLPWCYRRNCLPVSWQG